MRRILLALGLIAMVGGMGCDINANVDIGPCEGVSCGAGEVCEDGVCVPTDPCEGVNCDDDEACVNGVCVPT